MKRTYSLYEAKAKLSEIIRHVRERGASVTISYHGQAVAEIRPVQQADPEDRVAQRLRDLEANGAFLRAPGKPVFRAIAHRPGALQKFLKDRNRF